MIIETNSKDVHLITQETHKIYMLFEKWCKIYIKYVFIQIDILSG